MTKISEATARTATGTEMIPAEVANVATAYRLTVSDIVDLAKTGLESAQIGAAGTNYTNIGTDGTLTLVGAATAYEDLRIDGTQTRTGVVAPTDEVGFRGNSNFYSRNFVHNQADEVQFAVQLPHAWKEGGELFPHVHFSPWITNSGAAAARFIMEYYWANVNDPFPTPPLTYTMTKTWSGDQQWYHLIALNATAITTTSKTLSSVMKCRLYRDNTVTNNLAGKVALLYIDFHYEVDSFGSSQEYIK